MITTIQLARIEQAAALMENEPEMRCQVAMANIYKVAGLLPKDLEIPNGDRDWAQSQGRSLIEPWVESSGFFQRVDGPAEAGDLLGFRLGHTLHHVAIQLGGGRLVHVFGGHGVKIAVCIPSAWAKRLERVWRIKA